MGSLRTLHLEPLIPTSLWVALAVAAGVMLCWYGLRRPGLMTRSRWAAIVALMAAGVAAVLAVLLNPVWVEALPPPEGKPLLTVLVDKSASMAAPTAEGDGTRFAAACEIATDIAGSAGQRFEMRVQTFDDGMAPTPVDSWDGMEPDGERTDLASAIWSSVSLDRPAGQAVVLVSDGIDNAEGGAARLHEAVTLAKAMSTPIYTHTLGGDADVRDASVALPSPQELTFVNETLHVSAWVSQRGMAGRRAAVRLLEQGQAVASESIVLADRPNEVRFPIKRTEPGLYRYEVSVDPFPEEVTRLNNAHPFVLRVVDEPIRILLLEGKPYWDLKFLLRTLASDPAVELESIVQLTEERMMRRTLSRATDGDGDQRKEAWSVVRRDAGLLERMDRIRDYQIIMLGRESDGFLTDDAMMNLRDWVAQEGGSLVCYRGAPVSRVREELGRMLPVRWTEGAETRFRMSLTDRGQDLGWLASPDGSGGGQVFSQLPSLATTSETGTPRPLAVVLAISAATVAAGGTPVVSFQSYGSGRVVAIEGAGMWRWAFLPPDYQSLDEVYPRLWHSLLRWLVSGVGLMPGQPAALRPDKAAFDTQENVSATLLLREDEPGGVIPGVELESNGQAPVTFAPVPMGDEPGGFRVIFGRLPEGHYRARVAGMSDEQIGASAVFDVRGYIDEQLDLKARPALMARIAHDSGGDVLTGKQTTEITARFDEHQNRSRPQHVSRSLAWDRWWLMLSVFAVWTISWVVRRTGGLT